MRKHTTLTHFAAAQSDTMPPWAGYVKRLRDLEGSAGPAEGSVEQALQQRLREMKARFEEVPPPWSGAHQTMCDGFVGLERNC